MSLSEMREIAREGGRGNTKVYGESERVNDQRSVRMSVGLLLDISCEAGSEETGSDLPVFPSSSTKSLPPQTQVSLVDIPVGCSTRDYGIDDEWKGELGSASQLGDNVRTSKRSLSLPIIGRNTFRALRPQSMPR